MIRPLGSLLRHRHRPSRVKTPTVLQMEAVECGAASLAIVMAYHGRRVPLEVLRIACDVTRDGTKASNILRAARTYGLIGKGYRRTPETIRNLRLPVIVHWNFNHFVVLEGFKRNRAYLNDPALGRYAVSAREFDQAFTGVVLTLEPGPDFVRRRETRGLLAGLLPRIRHSKSALAFILLASLGLVVPGLAIPALTTVFIDQYLIRSLDDWVPPLLLIMGLIMVVNAGFTWLQQRYLLRLAVKLSVSSASAFLWHVLHLPIEFFHHRSPGEIGSRVTINDRLAAVLSGQVATAILSVTTMVFFLGLMLLYDVVLAIATVVMAGFNVVALVLVSRHRIDGNRRLLRDQGKLTGITMTGLRTIETLKASAAESDFFTKWSGHFAKTVNTRQRLGAYSAALDIVPPLLQGLNVALVLLLGSVRVMDAQLTIGMLVAFQYLMASFLAPVNNLVSLGGVLQETEGDVNRLDDVLHYRKAPHLANGPSPTHDVHKLTGALNLENVTFGYSRLGPPLFAGFSMTLPPGRWVALVGTSGCGKSTLARLVAGLYEPWDGTILFDGMPRSALPRTTIASSVALVDQDIQLYNDTMENNLSLWDPSLPPSQVVRAAKDARIHEFIEGRQGGYRTVVSEGGRNASGGQRQRIELARALAVNPSLLILDEATSALDPSTEREVLDNLRRRGCSCIVVAHRLSTIRDCDEIIVLDRGRVIERGSHQRLLELRGHYATVIAAA